MERFENWYSIVRYSPDVMRGEILNIGIIIHSPENNQIFYQFLKHNNPKIKSLLALQNSIELYKVHSDFITYYLDKALKNDDIFISSSNHRFFEHLKEVCPKEIYFSEPSFALTEDSSFLLKTLMSTYIGDEFLKESEVSQSKIRQYVRKAFDDRHLIDYKVKANAKIYPIKDKHSISYHVDFVYKNGVINLLQTAPSKDNMHNWFNKLNTFIDNYNSETVYHVLLNSDLKNIEDQTFKEMIEYLIERAPDNRFRLIDVNSNKFEELCNVIESTGQLIENFQHDLDNVI